VTDGTGSAASYDVRFAIAPLSWGSASSVTRGTCSTPVVGGTVGAKRTCTVLGLMPGTGYQFQLVAIRGVLGGAAVFGALSNVVSGTTLPGTLAPVATVLVSPATASISAGGAQQLAAALQDAAGNTLAGRLVTWSTTAAGVATVSASGLVTGVAAGAATITATSEGKSGSAAITVTATGAVVLFEEKFEDTNFAARGWYDLPAGMATGVTTAEHIPGSAHSLVIHFPQGTTTPTVAGRHLFAETGAVYFRYWIKYSANWVGSGQSYHPHEFLFITNEDPAYVGPAFTHLTTYVEHNYQNGGYARLAAQDGINIDQTRIGADLTSVTELRAVSGCNGNGDGTPGDCYSTGTAYNNGKTWSSAQAVFLPNPGPGYKNDWHQVEAYFKLNSIQGGKGQLDGVAQYWFDGQLVIDRHNVLLRTGVHTGMLFNQFLMAPYIGDGSPVDQTAWLDDLVVMTARP